MAALKFPTGAVVPTDTLIDLMIWDYPNEEGTDTVIQLFAQNNAGERFVVLELLGEENRATVEAKRDALATHLWGTVTDIATI